jgi:hypothetical protein
VPEAYDQAGQLRDENQLALTHLPTECAGVATAVWPHVALAVPNRSEAWWRNETAVEVRHIEE